MLGKLINNFIYVRDNRRYGIADYWRIMKMSRDGKYRGDCEDFALTALWILCGGRAFEFWKMLITGKAKIQHCKAFGEGHAVLYYKGRYIDNVSLAWQDKWFDGYIKYKGFNFVQVAFRLLSTKLRRAF